LPTPDVTPQVRAPTIAERRIFALLALLYAGVTLGAIPWAQLAGPRVPELIAVCNGGVALANICTALLLFYEFRRTGRDAFLCSWMRVRVQRRNGARPGGRVPRGARRAALRERTGFRLDFPVVAPRNGVVVPGSGVAGEGRSPATAARRPHRRVLYACFGTLAACAAIVLVAARLDLPALAGGRFTAYNLSIIAAYLSLCGLALYRIWRAHAFDDVLYLWLSLVLVASISDQLLASFAGGQYTLGGISRRPARSFRRACCSCSGWAACPYASVRHRSTRSRNMARRSS
jgi:hypothetical protein